MLTEAELEQIAARAEAATPGPWRHVSGIFKHWVRSAGNDLHLSLQELSQDDGHDVPAGANAAFIAASRSDVPALLADVLELRFQLQAARGSLEMAIRFVSHYGACPAPAMSFTWLMREKCTCEQGRFAFAAIDAAIARIDKALGGRE